MHSFCRYGIVVVFFDGLYHNYYMSVYRLFTVSVVRPVASAICSTVITFIDFSLRAVSSFPCSMPSASPFAHGLDVKLRKLVTFLLPLCGIELAAQYFFQFHISCFYRFKFTTAKVQKKADYQKIFRKYFGLQEEFTRSRPYKVSVCFLCSYRYNVFS